MSIWLLSDFIRKMTKRIAVKHELSSGGGGRADIERLPDHKSRLTSYVLQQLATHSLMRLGDLLHRKSSHTFSLICIFFFLGYIPLWARIYKIAFSHVSNRWCLILFLWSFFGVDFYWQEIISHYNLLKMKGFYKAELSA